MKKLSEKQLSRTSEIAGNIAVAWFVAGTVTPVFTKLPITIDLIGTIIISILVAGFFFIISLKLEERA